MTDLEQNRRRMVALLKELMPEEGLHASRVDGVRLSRADHSRPRMPVLYEPSIYIVASGRKRGFVGAREFVYDANNYLVLSVPLPFECETQVGNGDPLLGLSVRLDMAVISELACRMELRRAHDAEDDLSSVCSTPVDIRMSDATVRLLECLRSPVEAEILGPGIVRELVYRVLCGPQGNALLAMLNRNGQLAQIYAALQQIHRKYAEPLNVPDMAEEMGMSISAFHHNFKAVTSTSPLQYLKAVRLHKARMLMRFEGVGAAIAAERVGYESPSQFSREFKRYFGHNATDERVQMMAGADGPERMAEVRY
jgi:AraC-like DNA-binding protein